MNEKFLNDEWRDKIFKLWFGKSKDEVRKDVRKLSDKELLFLNKGDWSKSGGAQKIQYDEIQKEIKRRKL